MNVTGANFRNLRGAKKVERQEQTISPQIPTIITVPATESSCCHGTVRPEDDLVTKKLEQQEGDLFHNFFLSTCSRNTLIVQKNGQKDANPPKTYCSPRPSALLRRQRSESHLLSADGKKNASSSAASSPVHHVDDFKVKKNAMIEHDHLEENSSSESPPSKKSCKGALNTSASGHQNKKKKMRTPSLKLSQAPPPRKPNSLRRPRSEPALRHSAHATQEALNAGTKNAVLSTSSAITSVAGEDPTTTMKTIMEGASFLYDHSNSSTSTASSTKSSSSSTDKPHLKDHQKKKNKKSKSSTLGRPKSDPLLRRTISTSSKHSASTKNAVWGAPSSSTEPSKKSLKMRTVVEDVRLLSHEQPCRNAANTSNSENTEDERCSSHHPRSLQEQTKKDVCSPVHRGSARSSLRRQQSEPQLGRKKSSKKKSLSVEISESVGLVVNNGQHNKEKFPRHVHCHSEVHSTRCSSDRYSNKNKEANDMTISPEGMIRHSSKASSSLRQQGTASQLLVSEAREEGQANVQPEGGGKTHKIRSTTSKSSEKEQALECPVLPRRLIAHPSVTTKGGLTTMNTHQPRSIELKTGVVLRWRDSSETAQCIEEGNYRFTTCRACDKALCCLPTASYVLCPECKFATPLRSDFNEANCQDEGGITLGVGPELIQEHYKSVVRQEHNYRMLMLQA